MKKKAIFILTIIFINTFIPYPQANANTHRMDKKYFETTGEIVWHVKTTKKVIALTFDDGPHPKYTPKILDILKKYNVKATFFYCRRKCGKKQKTSFTRTGRRS